ncbi:beta-ketoacyl synthase N-terminal-like domain-containing protein [Streptomyces libani]
MSETRARRAGPRPTDAAIVGMGALFPGAEDLAAYWRNLVAGTDCITDVPPGRWDPEIYYNPQGAQGPARSDRFYCRRGGFLDDPAAFDPTRFGIMPAAVRGAEPDQLLALRTIADAIADAGGEERLPADRSRIGVILGRGGFMGVATARLDQRVRTAHQLAATLRELAPELGESRIAAAREAFQAGLGPEQPEASIGLVPSFTAARTANRLDFRGPAYTLDAACASSLLAVAQAVDLLAAGRCDLVVAGAVHHCHIATLWSVFTQLRALSPTQHIRPFDRRADGTLLSEGTGVVLLKRLADAERDGDRVYAVVRGTGVAGDGRAAGLMSPRAEGQIDALEQAWAAAGLDPADPTALGLLEAHGTGTPVGDGVELDTLARVFGPPGAGVPPVGLGSVKSMLGHTMQAAGIAGLIKAALAVHHRTLPPTLHLDEPHEGLARTRMRPVTVAEPWDAGRAPLRAGVNAFGFGGINAHTVLEEAPGRRSPAAPPPQRAASHRTASHRTAPLRTAPHRTSPHAPSPLRTAEPERTVLLAADTPAQLADQLREMGDFGAATGTGAPVPAPAPAPDGPCRLALPDPTPQRRALAAKILARTLPWRGRGEVWFTPSPLFGPYAPQEGARLAFLFPGLEAEPPPSVDDIADQMALPPSHGLRRQRSGRTRRGHPRHRPAARPRTGRTRPRPRPVDRPQPRRMDRHGGRRNVSAPGRGRLPRLAAARLPRRTRPGLRGRGLRCPTGGRRARGPGADRGQPRQLPAPVGDLRSATAARGGRPQTRRTGRTGPGDALPLRLPHPDVGALPASDRHRLRRPAATGPAAPRMVGDDGRPLPGRPLRDPPAGAAPPPGTGPLPGTDQAAVRDGRPRLRPAGRRQPPRVRLRHPPRSGPSRHHGSRLPPRRSRPTPPPGRRTVDRGPEPTLGAVGPGEWLCLGGWPRFGAWRCLDAWQRLGAWRCPGGWIGLGARLCPGYGSWHGLRRGPRHGRRRGTLRHGRCRGLRHGPSRGPRHGPRRGSGRSPCGDTARPRFAIGPPWSGDARPAASRARRSTPTPHPTPRPLPRRGRRGRGRGSAAASSAGRRGTGPAGPGRGPRRNPGRHPHRRRRRRRSTCPKRPRLRSRSGPPHLLRPPPHRNHSQHTHHLTHPPPHHPPPLPGDPPVRA